MKQEFNIELLIKAQSGEEEAQNILLDENKGLVHLIVNKFIGRGADFDDLFQLGMIGLYKAILNFDISREYKFSTYAVPMILGEIKRYLRDDGVIKVSRSVKELTIKIKQVQAGFEKEMYRAPKISELAQKLGVSSEEVVYALNASEPVFSLEELTNTEEKNLFLKDKIADKKATTEEEIVDKLFLKEALSKLDGKKRQIILFRFFKEMTQQQVSEIMGISQVQVCRIEKKVLKELKTMYISSNY